MEEKRGVYIESTFNGEKVDTAGREEQVRQKYIKKLLEDYGYDIEDIKIEVPIQMGSSTRYCDIAIYDEGKIVGIVETKARNIPLNEEYVRRQLESYMSATPTCRWGVLTNGDEERCGHRNFQTGEIHFGKELSCIKKVTWVEAVLKAEKDAWNLIEAAENGDIKAIRELLKAGADVNARDHDGWTVLIEAACKGHTEAIKELLNAGADIEAKSKDGFGFTALMWATSKGHTEAMRELLNAEADVNARDHDGMTALMWAACRGHTGAIRELWNVGADIIEARDNDGMTALMWAACNGQTEAIKELRKSDIEAKDNIGRTAFDVWQEFQKDHPDFQEISDLLLL